MIEPVWLDSVYFLAAYGNVAYASDRLLAGFDDLFLAGKFDEADELLDRIRLEAFDTLLLVALLSATAPAKDRLPGRPALVKRVEARLRELAPARLEGLMSGLR